MFQCVDKFAIYYDVPTLLKNENEMRYAIGFIFRNIEEE